jgi:hypothetical protein
MCDYVKITATDGTETESSTQGVADLGGNGGIMFKNHDVTTIAHECLHGLGLPHSFFGDSFLYKALKTDNIMDYSHLQVDKLTGLVRPSNEQLTRNSTWYWQWDILNPAII